MSRGDAELFSAAAITTFKLNGQFLTIAEELAKPAEITAAWWQVLGAVLHEPLPVSGIAREMGITRQSVQRIADLLVGKGLAEYRPNPSHRRAKLVAITDAGSAAIRRITPKHAVMAKQLARQLGPQRFAEVVDALGDLSAALEALESGDRGTSPD
ncbi:MarR family winged helix-turn-helix transcriptional regulator [Nocardia cerradoensis]|uniref:MarR family winged helix-turn-helix transcriptional regulator n=1 Tax=Nocardia cerradoensis TaxID=85688 RepID=UPI00031B0D9A|nr:MarR family transcriptional regulator [Nocardia cerradoensis]NKY46732.1 MarR family transcriptional regulator [Nocardia cerradoensis]